MTRSRRSAASLRLRLRLRLALAALSILLVAGACAARTSVTGWGYSSWFRRGGPGEEGAFLQHRDACLQQAGVSDPKQVTPDSPQENAFVRCMNAADWCTDAFHCQKPGV